MATIKSVTNEKKAVAAEKEAVSVMLTKQSEDVKDRDTKLAEANSRLLQAEKDLKQLKEEANSRLLQAEKGLRQLKEEADARLLQVEKDLKEKSVEVKQLKEDEVTYRKQHWNMSLEADKKLSNEKRQRAAISEYMNQLSTSNNSNKCYLTGEENKDMALHCYYCPSDFHHPQWLTAAGNTLTRLDSSNRNLVDKLNRLWKPAPISIDALLLQKASQMKLWSWNGAFTCELMNVCFSHFALFSFPFGLSF